MTKAERILEEIDKLYKELYKHQKRCKHKRLQKKFDGDTGNWDKSDDSCWVTVYCPTCKWKRTYYDDEPEYRMY